MSLADMFSSPIAAPPRSPRADPPTTPTRNAQPLFFSPGSAAGTPARPVAGPSTSRPAVPASVRAPTEEPYNFDIDDDDLPIPDIPPPLTSRPAANANANANQSIRQENGIFRGLTQAGGDFAPLIDPFAGVRAAADAGDEDGGGKKRRVMAKVDADRLMEANGLPALMQKAKRFKVRGKGREVEDLGELMNMYQLWAHKMFPKGDFAHTMQRVEVMCRGRRMNSALKGYREAFYPPRKSPSPIGRSPSPIRSEDEDEPINAPNGASAQRQHASQSRSRSPSHSQFRPMQAQRSSSPPLLSERNDEEMDMDEEAALEELMREEAQGEARTQGGSWSRATANGTSSMLGPEPLFAPGEPDDEELAALLEMQDDM